MKFHPIPAIFRLLILAAGLLVAPAIARAQAQCGVVQSIGFPVDPTFFRIAQDYAAASPRHDGRYHTGEDWTGPRGHTLGTPVRAIANGRVTFASENGWGRDGGVVIVEHKFPDGTTAYSMVGHIAAAPDVPFPVALTCVKQGDILGVIADVRPAPHVHFEIRANNPDIPGAGYSWDDPANGGWRQPSRFILDWQTWLLASSRWHFIYSAPDGPALPPVELDDHSLIFLDANRAGRLTLDGRVLWRTPLDGVVVGLTAQGKGALLIFSDGSAQPITRDGTLGERWSAPFQPDGAPLLAGDVLVFHSADRALVALDPVARAIRWTVASIPAPRRMFYSGGLIGLLTRDELLTVSLDGRLLGRAWLRDGAALASAPGGDLIAYTHGGLWRVGADGIWSLALPGAPPNSGAGSVTRRDGGGYFVFDGTNLGAYDATGVTLWQVALPGISGETALEIDGGVLLLTGTHGDLIALRAATGQGCATARVYGDDRSKPWHSLGDDGILRVALADQIFALNWQKFLAGCG